MKTMELEYGTHARDAEFGEMVERRESNHVRRTKNAKRRKSPKSSSLGARGVCQRRNKRWAW